MNKQDVQNVKAAVHQFMLLAPLIDHDSGPYRIRYENIMIRIEAVEASGGRGRKRKARLWRQQMEAVKPHS